MLPGNPRKGDVRAVMASYMEFGQRKPIVARREDNGRGTILAGNTQFQAARELGWDQIAVTWVDDDEKTAVSFALADNRTHDLGEYDDKLLAAAIEQLDDDPILRDASGYDLGDLQEIIDRIEEDEEAPRTESGDIPSPGMGHGNSVIQYNLQFTDESQQQNWFRFIRWLKGQFPDQESISDRIDAFIDSLGIVE
jgi:hypothetical protein